MKIIRKLPLYVVLIHVLCILYLQKNMRVVEVKFVRNFTLADKNNLIISIRTPLKRLKANDHEMCPENI